MTHLIKLADGVPVDAVCGQLAANPGLWNENPSRLGPDSPHRGCSDIWVRFRRRDDLASPADYASPHWAEFYPAWSLIPALRPIVFGVMGIVEATYLGGILITRIPPGGSVKPHTDHGWHAETMNCKVYVPLMANPDCINRCGDESAVMAPGSVWTFNNQVVHSVENNGATPRETLIICMRVE